MGYLHRAFVFLEEPNWRALEGVGRGRLLGYKHNDRPLWLMGQTTTARGIFTDWRGDELPPDLRNFEPRVRTMFQALAALREGGACSTNHGLGWLPLSLEVARASEVDTFFFVGDDETRNAAWTIARTGVLKNAAVRVERFVIVADSETVTCIHYRAKPNIGAHPGWRIVEGAAPSGDQGYSSLLSACRATLSNANVVLREEDDDRPYSFFYYPATMWPTAAGPPDQIVGLGTWDLFRHFDRDFKSVFESSKA
jgi:hypothetical protein